MGTKFCERGCPVTQQNEKRRRGFLQNVPGQVTLVVAAVVVMLVFVLTYIL